MARGFRVYDKLEKRMIDNPASESIYLSGNGNLVNVDHPEIYLMDRYVRMDWKDVEVIGNVYSNPELLK